MMTRCSFKTKVYFYFSGGRGRYNDNRGGFSGSDRYAAPGKDRFDSGDRFQNNRRGGRGRGFNDRSGSRTPQDRGGRGGRFNNNSRDDYQAPVQSRSNEEEENWDDDIAAPPSRPSAAPTQQFNSNNNARNDYQQNASKNRSNDDEENWDDDLAPSPAIRSVSTPKTNTSPKSMTMSGDQTPLWDED